MSKKGALVYLKPTAEGMRWSGGVAWPGLELRNQLDKLIANENGIKAEKGGENQAGPHTVQKTRFGEVNQCQNAETGQEHFGYRKGQSAFSDHSGHDRVYFDGAAIQ